MAVAESRDAACDSCAFPGVVVVPLSSGKGCVSTHGILSQSLAATPGPQLSGPCSSTRVGWVGIPSGQTSGALLPEPEANLSTVVRALGAGWGVGLGPSSRSSR